MDSLEEIRKEINQYIPKASDDFLIRVYIWMLQEEEGDFTDEQLKTLQSRRERHVNEESTSYTREEARQRLHDLLDK